MNYINTRGVHQFQTVDINTPLPGTYVPAALTNPFATGNYPYGQAAGIYNLYESGGIYKQNQVIFNLRAPINSRVSLQGYYAWDMPTPMRDIRPILTISLRTRARAVRHPQPHSS